MCNCKQFCYVSIFVVLFCPFCFLVHEETILLYWTYAVTVNVIKATSMTNETLHAANIYRVLFIFLDSKIEWALLPIYYLHVENMFQLIIVT